MEEIMKRTLIVILTAAMLAAFSGLALAGTPGVNRRQVRQHVRIAQGVASGQLTRAEAMRLRAGQRHINRAECRAKSDGVVTARERVRLQHMQNHESRAIFRFKHNARSR
jgi:hypothetical protein